MTINELIMELEIYRDQGYGVDGDSPVLLADWNEGYSEPCPFDSIVARDGTLVLGEVEGA